MGKLDYCYSAITRVFHSIANGRNSLLSYTR